MNRPMHFSVIALSAFSVLSSDATAQINEISTATDLFTPSFRSAANTTWLGWDEFDDNGAQNRVVDDQTPDVGTDLGSFVCNNGEMHISGSLNLYTGPGALDETLTLPSSGTAGTGFTTIIVQGKTLFGPWGSTIEFSQLGGIAPVENVQSVNAMGMGQFWVKYELPGNKAQYALDMTTAANGFISLDLLVVDSFWSTTDFAADSAVDSLLPPFENFCNGDGGDQVGCTDCPCGNNASQGAVGGCLNSSGNGTQLQASGTRSLSAADLRFDAMGTPSNSPAVLLSGTALAPNGSANPCFGMGSGISTSMFDGLRCVVQGLLRHGVRSSDMFGLVGSTNPGWGQADGFFNFAAFAAGETRYFQIVHRDLDTMGCQTGLNTSQAVAVTFEP